MNVATKEAPQVDLGLKVEELTKELTLVRNQSVAALGDGEVFVKRGPDGALRAVRGMITLQETNGEIAPIQGKTMTTGKGFYKANQVASLSIITPQKLTLPDGSVVVNPYPIIDQESGTIRKIWVKKMAVGYSPVGNMVITSVTLLYDLNAYFIQDLLKKVTKNKEAGRVCLESMLTEDEKKKGVFYKIDGGLGVWGDFNHPDILKCIDTFVNKKQFAERNAQTICERLAFAKHPALAHISMVDAQGTEKRQVAKVPVVGYIHDLSREQLEDIADQAERDEEVKVDGQKVEVVETTAEATYEDVAVHDDDEKMVQDAQTVSEEDVPDSLKEGTQKPQHNGSTPPSTLFGGGDKF